MSATNRGSSRPPGDFYRTPVWCTRAILRHLPKSGGVIDAGCGDGAILSVLTAADTFDEIVGVELNPELAEKARDAIDLQGNSRIENVDFLTLKGSPSLVISNPPFSFALEFVSHALEMVASVNGTVAMLLRLGWLEGQSRAGFHNSTPCDVYVMSKRPSFTGGGTDATGYGWFVFGPGRGNRWSILNVEPEDER